MLQQSHGESHVVKGQLAEILSSVDNIWSDIDDINSRAKKKAEYDPNAL